MPTIPTIINLVNNMTHYIDAEKLKVLLSDLEENHKYYNGDFHDGVVFTVDKAKEIIDSLQQEQSEVDLEKEIDKEWRKCCPTDEGMGDEKAILVGEQFHQIARHFAEWGRKQVLQEIYEGKVKPVDKITAAWLDDEQHT